VGYIQKILKELFDAEIEESLGGQTMEVPTLQVFPEQLRIKLETSAVDPDVVGFKSIVCYRTGLDVQVRQSFGGCIKSFVELLVAYQQTGTIRLANKPLNDYVVTVALEVAAEYKKPGR